MSSRFWAGWVVWVGSMGLLLGRDVAVKNVAELKGAVASASSGDVIKLAKGHYDNVNVKVAHNGAQGRPITILSAQPGEAIFGGTSTFEINGAHVVLDGLFFYKGASAGDDHDRAVIMFNSHHGVIRNTAIVDYNPTEFANGYYWIFFNGNYNLADRCYFKGKNNLQPLVGNGLEGSHHNGVTNCYFKNIPYDVGNGREDIRVWGSGKFDEKTTDGAYFTIQGNLFDHADGEGTEIISLKSNFNQVINNTVVATLGGINIRRGSNNVLKGNVVLGEGLAGAHGLRMSGPNHTVQGNYVSGCDYGIRISAGEFVGYALTSSYAPHEKSNAKTAKNVLGIVSAYPQCKKVTVSNNVIVGCTGVDLEIGSDYKKHWPEEQLVLMPSDCDIANNRFIKPAGGVAIEAATLDSKISLVGPKNIPNRFKGNVVIGGKVKLPAAEGGTSLGTLPQGWSEEKELVGFKPLTPKDVGPAWVIALREADDFPMEDDMSCSRNLETAKAAKKKKTKTK